MLVTHDMGVIAETADRVAVMYAGRIVEIGPVDEVIHRPAHPYTVGLMGSIPSIVDERARLAQIDGTMPRLDAIPGGCAFHPRCPRAIERCRHELPVLTVVGATRAACWRPHVDAARARRWLTRCSTLADLARTFDVSPPWLDRVLERKPRALLKAVDGVSLSIAKGETLGLVGESGCGKSTVARMIVGLYAPTRGTITFDGTVLAGAGASAADGAAQRRARRGMQMIFQDPYASLNPRWRVADIVAEPILAQEPEVTKAESSGARRGAARRRSASRRPTASSIRISSRAGSGNGSRSPARCRRSRASWSATSPPPRSTSRCRRRC